MISFQRPASWRCFRQVSAGPTMSPWMKRIGGPSPRRSNASLKQTLRSPGMKLVIQIPCLNEEESLPQVLSELPREVVGFDAVEWLGVDDGPTPRAGQRGGGDW